MKLNSNQAQLHVQFLRYTVKRSKVKRTERIILIHLNQKRSTFANFFFKFSNIAGYACSIPTIPSLPHPVYLFPPTGIPFPLAIPLFPALSSFRTVPPLSIPFPSFSIPVGRATVCCNSPAVSSYASLHARERQNIGHISLSFFSHTIRE